VAPKNLNALASRGFTHSRTSQIGIASLPNQPLAYSFGHANAHQLRVMVTVQGAHEMILIRYVPADILTEPCPLAVEATTLTVVSTSSPAALVIGLEASTRNALIGQARVEPRFSVHVNPYWPPAKVKGSLS